LLHRFRHKKCTIRRDRIYSLLALLKEGKTIKVDYDLPEEKIMCQGLNVRESSICICSTTIVAQALAPWDFEAIKEGEGNAEFAELNMYAIALSSTACQLCAHWMPFSWTRKKRVVLCFETACSDTPGHIFWEPPDTIETADEVDKLDRIHLQLRQNNTSRLLCETGQRLYITKGEEVHMYMRFTFRTFIEALLDDTGASDLGINACRNLWPDESVRQTTGGSRLQIME
jgi:hypothetical protein